MDSAKQFILYCCESQDLETDIVNQIEQMGVVRSIDSKRTIKNAQSVTYYSYQEESLANVLKISLQEPSPHQLYSLAHTCPKLLQLTITLPIDNKDVVRAICAIKSLQHLTFGPRQTIKQEAIELITDSLPRLISLRSQKMGLRDAEASLIGSRLRNLKFISLNKNRITCIGLKVIIDNCPHLTVLELLDNSLIHNPPPRLDDLIASQLPHLQTLYLNNVQIESYQPFAEKLPNLRKFKVISTDRVKGSIYLGLMKNLEQCQFYIDNSFNLPLTHSKLAYNCKKLEKSATADRLGVTLHSQRAVSYSSRYGDQRNHKLFQELKKRERLRMSEI